MGEECLPLWPAVVAANVVSKENDPFRRKVWGVVAFLALVGGVALYLLL